MLCCNYDFMYAIWQNMIDGMQVQLSYISIKEVHRKRIHADRSILSHVRLTQKHPIRGARFCPKKNTRNKNTPPPKKLWCILLRTKKPPPPAGQPISHISHFSPFSYLIRPGAVDFSGIPAYNTDIRKHPD